MELLVTVFWVGYGLAISWSSRYLRKGTVKHMIKVGCP